MTARDLIGGSSDRRDEQEHSCDHNRPRAAPPGSRIVALPRCTRGRSERRVLIENPALELPQALARLQAELIYQRPAPFLVGLQRLGLPPGAVEGEHELSPEPFAERVLGDERLQFADELMVASELEVCFDPLLLSREAELVEPGDLRLGEIRVSKLGQCGASPQSERLSQLLGRALGLAT